MEPLISEPHLWRIVQDEEDESDEPTKKILGLMMTYVDDIVVVSTEDILQATVARIQEQWQTPTPTKISEKPTRFLGMDVVKEYSHEKERDIWYLTQEGFVRAILKKEEGKIKPKKVPITREQSIIEDLKLMQEEITPLQVKEAQR